MNLSSLFFTILSCILAVTFIFHQIFKPKRIDLSIFDDFAKPNDPGSNICLQTLTDLNSNLLYRRHVIHKDYINLRPCVLDINYNFSAKFHVIIIGSSSSIAISLIELLEKSPIDYVEIKNKIHFNMLQQPIYDIFDTIQNEILVLDFQHISNDYATKKIDDYFQNREIPIVRVVSTFSKNNYPIQLKIPRIFGPSYQRHLDSANSLYYDCILNRTHKNATISDGNAQYMFSYDVAKYIFDNLNTYRQFQTLNMNHCIEPKVKQYTQNELIQFISQKYENCQLKDSNSRPKMNSISIPQSFKLVDSTFHSLLPNPSSPYVSHVITISELPRVANNYQIILHALATILPKYPMISVEFIAVYSSLVDKPFSEVYDLPPAVEKYYTKIIITAEIQKAIMKRVNSKFFPEYVLRNIGARRARGTYIICGSSDILMPPCFFISAEQRLFSPLSYIKSDRQNINPVQIPSVLNSLNTLMYSLQYWAHQDTGLTDKGFSLLLFASGDFQGCHRLMWEAIKGYIESEMIFHVDSIFSLDLSWFCAPLLVRFLPGEKHLNHIQTSHRTPTLPTFYIYFLNSLYNGYSSYNINRRPNWGHGVIDIDGL